MSTAEMSTSTGGSCDIADGNPYMTPCSADRYRDEPNDVGDPRLWCCGRHLADEASEELLDIVKRMDLLLPHLQAQHTIDRGGPESHAEAICSHGVILAARTLFADTRTFLTKIGEIA